MASRPSKLTQKQARFVEEYLVDLNAAAAARRAGYTSRRSEAIGYEILTKHDVQAAISAAQRERSARTGVTADRVIQEIARIAFADPRDIMEWGPSGVMARESSELSDDQAAAVAEVHETKTKDGGGSMRVKLHSKTDALDKLCRHLGLYDDKPKDDNQTVMVYIPSNGRD